MSKLAEYKKAIAGFAAPGLALVVTSVTPGSDGGTVITGTEWVLIAVACAAGGLGVSLAPKNDEPAP